MEPQIITQTEEVRPERTNETDRRLYTFTWQFEEYGRLAPRGGRRKDLLWSWIDLPHHSF